VPGTAPLARRSCWKPGSSSKTPPRQGAPTQCSRPGWCRGETCPFPKAKNQSGDRRCRPSTLRSPARGAVMVAVPLAGWLCPRLRAGLARPRCAVRPVGERVPAAAQLRGDGLRALRGEKQPAPGPRLATSGTPGNPAPRGANPLLPIPGCQHSPGCRGGCCCGSRPPGSGRARRSPGCRRRSPPAALPADERREGWSPQALCTARTWSPAGARSEAFPPIPPLTWPQKPAPSPEWRKVL